MLLKNEQMQDIEISRDLFVVVKKILLQMIMQNNNAFINHEIKFML